jgi:cerevisin
MKPSSIISKQHLVPNQYIVLMQSHNVNTQLEDIDGVKVQHWFEFPAQYSSEQALLAEPMYGFIARIDSDAALERLRSRPDIAAIEQDQLVFASGGGGTVTQHNATWGLQRISQHEPLQSTDEDRKYRYPKSAGHGVDVYVIDTGVNVKHHDFSGDKVGRARWGVTIPSGERDEDTNGHGSHVAGTIAGTSFGVAKRANIIAVKVLRSDGSGSMSDVVRGVEWVLQQHKKRTEFDVNGRRRARKSVANMSLGGGKSIILERAVNNAVAGGVYFAVAAGNSFDDACNYSPAGADSTVTVGASTIEDRMASFSNYGPCVDIVAPGKDITSIWTGARGAQKTISGTSMASPHVAGAMAVILGAEYGEHDDLPSAKTMTQLLIKRSTKDVLSALPAGQRTRNRLLFSAPSPPK